MKNATKGVRLPQTGALMCQCEKDIKRYGKGKYYGWYKVIDDKYNFTDSYGLERKDVELCRGYVDDMIKASGLNNSIKYIIIALNYVIRVVVIKIISLMRCSTESTQMIYITEMVFICQFFNTGILPMLCTANLEGQLPPKIVSLFNLKGDSSDFDQDWFVNIGDTIVGSMVFNVIFPVFMEIGWFCYRSTFRILDGLNP